MDFEQYLERDILTFLDSKIYKKESTSIDREEEYGLYLTKDYLKELNYALDNDELTRAKKLFDELKTNYSKLPKNSVERKKIYSLLEKMYEKIQNYVRIKEGKIEIIKQGEMEILKDNSEKLSSIADRIEKTSQATDKNITPESTEALLKKTQLPIRLGAKTEPKKDVSNENILLEKKKSPDEEKTKTEPDKKEEKDKEETTKETPETEKVEKTVMKDIRKHRETLNALEERKISEFPEINQRFDKKKDSEITGKSLEKEVKSDEWKEEIIHKTTKHLERLKVHVVDKLLEELRKKLDEKSDEQNKKIESLRNEIVSQVIAELDKRLKREKRAVSEKIELLRDEILDKVYQQAPQIISSNDNYSAYNSDRRYNADNIYSVPKSLSEESADSTLLNQIIPETNTEKISVNRDEVYTKAYGDDDTDTSENIGDVYVDKTPLNEKTYSDYSADDLRVIYEQAIYYMFENKYEDAAVLFKKILEVQPTNKAAQIRLRECIEKQPGIDSINSKDKAERILSEIDELTQGNSDDVEADLEDDSGNEFSSALNEPLNDFTEDIRNITSDNGYNSIMLDQFGNKINTETYKNNDSAIGQYSNEELRVVYEQAIYYMSDNKYNEAAKLFKKIIEVQPANKAAKIRLRECIEKQPEISEDNETITNSDLETVVKKKQRKTKDIENSDELIDESTTKTNQETYKDESVEEDKPDKINNFEEEIKRLQKRTSIKQKYSDEELQKMYEEAIYTMFQNNYAEAAKIFHQILRIRPENKAARIRLQECKEASGNA